ncbi:MAG: VanZ family protein [Ignavibacteriales bacterium]
MDLKRVIIYWFLAIIWMSIIFQFSSKPAIQSDTQSLFVIQEINRIANNFGFKGEFLNNGWNYFIRKIAHTLEYAVLGMLLCLALSSTGIKDKKLFLYSILICLIYAVTDEIHQAFVPGRAAKVTDVLIDTFGGFIGIGLTSLLAHFKWHNGRIIKE